MRAEAPTAFPAWETTAPALLPRTQLYHLEPIGVGTAWTESLTSYIARLADAHCVRVSTLVAREIGPRVQERGGVQALAQHNWTHYSHALNGAAATAQVLVDVLQTLTGQPDLRFLTMLPWNGVLPPVGLLHRERAWCPACYQEWRERGQRPYEPLLWAVSAVTGCPHHGCDLCRRCPVCQQGQPPLAVAVRPGYCARCGSWLGQARSDPCGSGRVAALSAWAQWAAEGVGDLIAAAPTLTTRPTPEHLAQAIAYYTAGDAETGPLEIAHAAHMSHSHLWSWRRGLSMPTLPVLLRLCGSLGLMPLQLLAPSLPVALERQALTHRVIPPPKRRLRPWEREDHATIRRRVDEFVRCGSPPPSLRQVAAAVGHDQQTLRSACPDLCASIVANRRAYRRAQKLQHDQDLATAVRHAILQVQAAGLPLTTKRVGAFLPHRAYLRTPVARQAWQDRLRELGLEP
jgi:transcriptional regulator with XRE-family HTH domain